MFALVVEIEVFVPNTREIELCGAKPCHYINAPARTYLSHSSFVSLLDWFLIAFVVDETNKTCFTILGNLFFEMLLRSIQLPVAICQQL